MGSRGFVCICGAAFETAQQKAAHCKVCEAYAAQMAGGDRVATRSQTQQQARTGGARRAGRPAKKSVKAAEFAPKKGEEAPSGPVPKRRKSEGERAPPLEPSGGMTAAEFFAQNRVLERVEQDNYSDMSGFVYGSRGRVHTTMTHGELVAGFSAGMATDAAMGGADGSSEDDDEEEFGAKRTRKSGKRKSLHAVAQTAMARRAKMCMPLLAALTSGGCELAKNNGGPNGPGSNWLTVAAGEPVRPRRRFCAMCGAFAKYTCGTCGIKFCSVKCNNVHKDTRCMKDVRYL